MGTSLIHHDSRRPRVVVVGAGFGGLAAARALRRLPVDVLLVDRVNYHTFQPLLYQVATAGLEPEEIAHSVRAILRRQRNFSFRVGTVSGADWDRREISFEDGDRVSYDYLVVAVGASTADYGIPGVAEHAFGLKTLADAVNLRSHVLECFESASREPSSIDRGALTFVIAGGGPSGVEMAGALVELFEHVLRRDYPALDVSRAKVVLLEREDRVLSAFHASSRGYALDQMRRRGIEVCLSSTVVRAAPDHVELAGGPTIPTRTLLWAAGVRANALAGRLDLERTSAGRVVVESDLSLPGHPEVFAIGDVAASRGAGGALHPQLAPVAIQGGRHVGRAIAARLRGVPSPTFVYRDPGMMATIGRNAAVAELSSGPRLRGRIGWITWLLLHLVQLIGFRNRVFVLLNWAWSYFTYERGPRLIVRVEDEPSG
ncbi:MAG: NAD(P)/FAD-dependent oxidoreductase [Planctomycetota bacterium]